MSTPPQLDPLANQPLSPTKSSLLSSSSSTPPNQVPLSFKRRTPSRSGIGVSNLIGNRTSLLGSILSRSAEDEFDRVPSSPTRTAGTSSRTEPPNHIEITNSNFINKNNNLRLDVTEGTESSLINDRTISTPSPIRRESSAGRRFGSYKQREVSWVKSSLPNRFSSMNGGLIKGEGSGSSTTLNDGEDRESYHEDDYLEEQGQNGVTPLPLLPMCVLCIAMLGEFLCASVSSPFLYFMIESFGVGQGEDGGGEAIVGLWTGIVGSTFFLSQFLTSLLWVSVAEKHGRRAVLFTSLLGNSCTIMLFGTSKNLGTAICIRLAMGLFNGAVGVARGAVQNITDPSNEGRAFTLMGLCWGLGGIVGSIIGGTTESPVRNLPLLFGDSILFANYPYLLPCMIAGSVTGVGAILSLFLSPDGGPREGGIRLPNEKDVENVAGTVGAIPRKLVKKISSYFQSESGSHTGSPDRVPLHRADSAPSVPLSPDEGRRERNGLSISKVPSRNSGSAYGYNNILSVGGHMNRPSTLGSAYGYDGPRFASYRRRRNTGQSRFRMASTATSTRYAPDYDDVEHQELNFAQRLLLANEGAVFSLSDLWVADATRVDDQYSQYDGNESVFEDEEDPLEDEGAEPDFFGYGTAPPSLEDIRSHAARQDIIQLSSDTLSPSRLPSSTVPGTRNRARTMESRRSPSGERERVISFGNKYRNSMASSPRTPAIYANTGLNPQSFAGAMSPSLPTTVQSDSSYMTAIPEARPASIIEIEAPSSPRSMLEMEKPPVSLLRQLPLVLIGQYALLALHGTVCDAVFMSFLVTPVPSGGLGLSPSNYAVLVACMFFFSMIWQFQFYPSVSSPRGSLSHLAMFRLGLFLYLPVYLLFPELRGLLHEHGNGKVMFGMGLLSAIRYLANTCAYTSIMILINAMSPPHLIPLANGLAQSAVSLARFMGPILGGTIWAASIAHGPAANPWPLNYAAGFVVIAVLCFVGLLHSFRIH